jgi:hypothetical protein
MKAAIAPRFAVVDRDRVRYGYSAAAFPHGARAARSGSISTLRAPANAGAIAWARRILRTPVRVPDRYPADDPFPGTSTTSHVYDQQTATAARPTLAAASC